MEGNDVCAYLDHNVLDFMTKGDPYNVKELLQKCKLVPIYSIETLKEIQRSKGYENVFFKLLEDIGARYIEPLLDSGFRQTGQARIHMASPKSFYDRFLSNQSENPFGDFGLSEMLSKFYGGQQNRSFKEISEQGAVDLQQYLLKAIEGIDQLPLNGAIDIEVLKKIVVDLPEIMNCNFSTMAKELDERSDSPMSEFEKITGLGPIILNNIKPPNVVEKIWRIVYEKGDIPDSVDIETFFGVKPHSFEQDPDRERTLQEKVNAIYHQLNFLGYYRDSKMKKERRFKASFSDMTHAGFASFCHLFLCRDRDLVMKAAAAYEYLGVNTRILFFKANNSMQPIADAPAD